MRHKALDILAIYKVVNVLLDLKWGLGKFETKICQMLHWEQQTKTLKDESIKRYVRTKRL